MLHTPRQRCAISAPIILTLSRRVPDLEIPTTPNNHRWHSPPSATGYTSAFIFSSRSESRCDLCGFVKRLYRSSHTETLMKLLTQAQREQLPANGFAQREAIRSGADEITPLDPMPVVKLFTPYCGAIRCWERTRNILE